MRAPSRSSRLVPLLAVTLAGALLAGTATLPSYAASDEPGVDDPAGQPASADPLADPGTPDPVADPGTPQQVAEESLAAAQDLVAGDSTADPTLVLNQLSETLADLPAGDRRRAGQILARPTRGGSNDGLLEYRVDEAAPVCRVHVCVHYVNRDDDPKDEVDHRPPMADTTPANGIPDWVELTADVMEYVWDREVGQLGYRPPLADGGTPANDAGPTPGLDVFLGDVGSQGIYGYAAADRSAPRTSSAYLVLDNDYTNRQLGGGDPEGLLQVTAAHEFFHAVQFGYDQYEDAWFQEATATWMEERVYDDVNDNRQFLRDSSLVRPGLSLDSPAGLTWYGNWVFFEFLSERLGDDAIRTMWRRAGNLTRGTYSMQAIRSTLASFDTSLAVRLLGFSSSGLVPGRSFDEGSHFPRARPAHTWRLSTGTRSTGSRRITLDHLAGRHYAFAPGTSLTGAWKLRVAVDGPGGLTRVMAILHKKDGSLVRRQIEVGPAGRGATSFYFSRATISRVTLTMVNTSSRYACRAGAYSCSGAARDQDQPFTFSARASR